MVSNALSAVPYHSDQVYRTATRHLNTKNECRVGWIDSSCAGDHAVRPVPFDVGDDFAIEVDLVQVARAVVQVVQDAAILLRRLNTSRQLKRIICPVQPQLHCG